MDIEKKIFVSEIMIKFLQKIFIYIILILIALFMILPFIWMVSASIKPNNEVFNFPIEWIPKTFRLQNYIDIWNQINFLTHYKNTVFLTVVVTFCVLLTSSLAAYAFSKIDFPEKKAIFVFNVMLMAIPFVVIMIPQFIIIKTLQLSDTLWALILIYSFSPYCVFLTRQFFMTIPNELCESARMDGLKEFGIYLKIMLPLSKPVFSTLGIFQFVFVWNDFLAPLIFLTSDKNKTIQLGISMFYTQYGVEYGLIMAASVSALIPVIIIYIFFQKFLIQGIATTGLKG